MTTPRINTTPALSTTDPDSSWMIALRRMYNFPNISRKDACREARRIGETGELAFRTFLVSFGFSVVDFPDVSPVDVGIVLGQRCVRFQVKTVTSCRNGFYHSTFKRGFGGSARGIFEYSADDYDVGVTAIPGAGTFVFHSDLSKRSFRVSADDVPSLYENQRMRLYLALVEIGALSADDLVQISTPLT